MIFPRFSHVFALIFPWCCNDFPRFLPWFSHDFVIIVQWFTHVFALILPWISNDFPRIFPWFCHVPSRFGYLSPRSEAGLSGPRALALGECFSGSGGRSPSFHGDVPHVFPCFPTFSHFFPPMSWSIVQNWCPMMSKTYIYIIIYIYVRHNVCYHFENGKTPSFHMNDFLPMGISGVKATCHDGTVCETGSAVAFARGLVWPCQCSEKVGAGVSIFSSLCGFMRLEQAPVKLEGPRTWFPAPKAWPERELRRGPGLAGCGRAQGAGFAPKKIEP